MIMNSWISSTEAPNKYSISACQINQLWTFQMQTCVNVRVLEPLSKRNFQTTALGPATLLPEPVRCTGALGAGAAEAKARTEKMPGTKWGPAIFMVLTRQYHDLWKTFGSAKCKYIYVQQMWCSMAVAKKPRTCVTQLCQVDCYDIGLI